MAMTLDTAIKFTAKLEGQGLDQLKRNLQGLSQQSTVSKRSLDQLYTATQKLGAASGNTIAGLQKTVASLKALRDNAEFGSRSFKLLTRDIEAAEARLRKFQGAASSSSGIGRGGAFLAGIAGGVAGSLTTMAAGGIMGAGRGVAQVGIDAEAARVRLRALANEFGELNQAQAAAARIAQTLRISTTEAEQGFASLYASLRPTGVTLTELEKAFIGFSAAARNSGATAQETSNALIQLKQGLASGTLQGEELRSIREQAPLVAQAIAKEMGVTIGELKDLAAEGKVTTDVVLRALGRLNETQLGKLNEQFDTGQQALKDLRVAGEELGRTLSRIFGPTAVSLLRRFTSALKEANDILGGITGDGDAGRRAQLRVQANQQAARETNERFGIFAPFQQGSKQDFLLKREQEIYQQLLQQDQQRQRARQQDNANAEQLAARQAAERERAAAQARAAAEADKERLKNAQEEAKIRLDTERRLADFRQQSLERARDLERSLGDQRLELERSTAEARRRVAAQQADFELERERQRRRAMGLGTESLDLQARLNEGTRRFTEQKIQIEQQATDKKVQVERALEDYKLSVANGIRDILVDAGRKLADHMKKGGEAAAAAMGSPVAGGRTGGIIARTGSTGQSTGPHLDARWADGRPITAADVDRYLMVNGRDPSSFGVTSPYGPRRMFGRNFHSGIDFGTPSGSGISLRNGASLLRDLGFTGAGGYAVEIDTPQGRMRLLHLQPGSAARPTGSARQLIGNAGTGANLPGMDGVRAAGSRLDAAIGANRGANLEAAAGDLVANRQQAFSEVTGQLNEQLKSVREQRAEFDLITQLQRSGISPELAKQSAERVRMAAAEREQLQTLEQQLVKDLQGTDLTAKQRTDMEGILKAVRERIAAQPEILAGMEQEARQLEALQKQQQRMRELVSSIGETLSNGIIGAIDASIEAAMTGAEGLEDKLKQIAKGVLQDIGRALIRFGLNSLASGFGLGNFFKFADGGVMTSAGPLPLRRYAVGGIANSPQVAMFGERGPEAYVPLPDGRNIPVKLSGTRQAEAMDRYRPVPKGVMAGPDGEPMAGGAGAAVAAGGTIDVRYSVERINNVEYVTAEQFRAGIQNAAREGANRGEQQALRRLQNAPSARRRIGI